MECKQTSKNAAHCACGGMMYEDSEGALYCVTSNTMLFKPQSSEPRHATSCHRDDEGVWNCHAHCAVKMAQIGMFA